MNTRRNLLTLSFFAFASVIFSACALGSKQNTSSLPVPTPTPVVVETNTPAKLKAEYELTATNSAQTALELIEANATVETKDYGTAGKFVTSINGLAGNNEYYWGFYLNGEYAKKGVSQTMLKTGDTIKFIYEAVTPTP